MTNIWQELDKLRKDVESLKRRVSRQSAVIAKNPVIKIGKMLQTNDSGTARKYNVQEIGVTTEKERGFCGLHTLPGDPGPSFSLSPVVFFIDSKGYRYLLPQPDRVILVKDLGNGTGKRVEKNRDEAVTVPPGSETLSLIVAEPNANFHDSTPPTLANRIYPGQLMIDENNTGYYLVFLAGHGEGSKNLDATLSDSTTLRVTVDYAGKIIGVTNV